MTTPEILSGTDLPEFPTQFEQSLVTVIDPSESWVFDELRMNPREYTSARTHVEDDSLFVRATVGDIPRTTDKCVIFRISDKIDNDLDVTWLGIRVSAEQYHAVGMWEGVYLIYQKAQTLHWSEVQEFLLAAVSGEIKATDIAELPEQARSRHKQQQSGTRPQSLERMKATARN